MDEVISTRIPEEVFNAEVYKKWGKFIEVQDIGNDFAHVYSIVLQFEPELPKSSERVRAHTVKILEFACRPGVAYKNTNRTHGNTSWQCVCHLLKNENRNEAPYEAPSSKKEALKNMLNNASLDFCRKLLEELLDKCFF